MEVNGYVAPGFEQVAEEFSRNFTVRDDLGASFAVMRDDEPLVDLWGGIADRASARAWTADTLQILFSGTKGLVAACVLLLMERGQLALESPVARYWPEFAANGKEQVEVRHLLSHTSGVSGWERPFSVEDMYDWETSIARLAAQAPWWAPAPRPATTHSTRGTSSAR